MASPAFLRLRAYLEVHAPRTRASLLPPASPDALAALGQDFHCALPPGFADLYLTSAGQSAADAAALFRGHFFLPLRGIDGVETAWDQMLEAHEAGAPWASNDRYPFAKDFAGNFLCVDDAGAVLAIDEGEVTTLAGSIEAFLTDLADALEAGELSLEDPPPPPPAPAAPSPPVAARARPVETFEVLFDAARDRTPGEPVHNSAFVELGIEARVQALAEVVGPTDGPLHGFAVRMVPRDDRVTLGGLEDMALTDDRGRPLKAAYGQGTGGGLPGFFVHVSSPTGPLPPGSRLRIRLHRTT
ncbi:MAG: SMI1/KNR4 family protein [Myxococcales bacterium]|nr:MAG: SMI1/KNR4 family protein [Myxococcales bacterium]